jgi:hypothetical protein
MRMTRTPREADHRKRSAGNPLSLITSGISQVSSGLSRVSAGLGRARRTLRGRTLIYAGAGLAIAGAGVATVTAGVSATAPAAADALSASRAVAPVTAGHQHSPASRQHGHPENHARPATTHGASSAGVAAHAENRKPATRKAAAPKPVTRKAAAPKAAAPKPVTPKPVSHKTVTPRSVSHKTAKPVTHKTAAPKPVTHKTAAPKPAVVHHHREHVRPACHGSGVSLWTCEAFRVLAAHGESRHLLDPGAVAIIAQGESGGNPAAVNNWDSNAVAGTPSTGLMQTIAPTFQQYCLSGHCGSMLNPVDDIIAATRYADARYGGVASVPGVQAVRAGGSYVGY